MSLWKRYSIQQHAGNTEGLTDASGDDRGTLGQERGLCRERKCKDINIKYFKATVSFILAEIVSKPYGSADRDKRA